MLVLLVVFTVDESATPQASLRSYCRSSTPVGKQSWVIKNGGKWLNVSVEFGLTVISSTRVKIELVRSSWCRSNTFVDILSRRLNYIEYAWTQRGHCNG